MGMGLPPENCHCPRLLFPLTRRAPNTVLSMIRSYSLVWSVTKAPSSWPAHSKKQGMEWNLEMKPRRIGLLITDSKFRNYISIIIQWGTRREDLQDPPSEFHISFLTILDRGYALEYFASRVGLFLGEQLHYSSEAPFFFGRMHMFFLVNNIPPGLAQWVVQWLDYGPVISALRYMATIVFQSR